MQEEYEKSVLAEGGHAEMIIWGITFVYVIIIFLAGYFKAGKLSQYHSAFRKI